MACNPTWDRPAVITVVTLFQSLRGCLTTRRAERSWTWRLPRICSPGVLWCGVVWCAAVCCGVLCCAVPPPPPPPPQPPPPRGPCPRLQSPCSLLLVPGMCFRTSVRGWYFDFRLPSQRPSRAQVVLYVSWQLALRSLQGGFFNFSPLNLAKSQSLYKIPYFNFFYRILILVLGLSQI